MDVDRELLVEIIVATVPVLLLVGMMVVAGMTYTSNDELSATGGKALVAGIVAFVFVLAGLGYWLARSEF